VLGPRPASPTTRDTDADWRAIGAREPFWGVLTWPEYRRENLDEDRLAAFYATGVNHIAGIAGELAHIGGAPFHVDAALDFGCGVGRLTEAMGAYADQIIGYDISPGMLEEARARGAGKAVYTGVLPDGPFDWINSYIVFQHIPPQAGLDLLEQLLAKLTARGFVSLHFTVYRDAHLRPPVERRTLRSMFARRAPAAPAGSMQMYDYDLGRLCEALHRHGVERMRLVHEDHGGHHSVHVFARRER
jgi:SAM-dependent methyltransferase